MIIKPILLNNNLGGNRLIYNESKDAYYIQNGADSVPKKLGSGDFTIKATITIAGYYDNGSPAGSGNAKITITCKDGITAVTGLPTGNIYQSYTDVYIRISAFTINSIVF